MAGLRGEEIGELVVPYDPTPTAARVQRRRRAVRQRILSLGISIVFLIVIYFWQRQAITGPSYFVIAGIVLALGLGWIGLNVALLRIAERDFSSGSQGVAVRIGRGGVEVAGLAAGWADLATLAVVRARFGSVPRLQLSTTSGATSSVLLEQLSVPPGTLDSTARAYSASRHGVDLTALDA